MGRADAAAKLNGKMRAHAERSRSTLRANVVDTDPLTIHLEGDGIDLVVGDDFDLTAWVRMYDADYGLDEDETVLVQRERGHYIVFDVLTDKDI